MMVNSVVRKELNKDYTPDGFCVSIDIPKYLLKNSKFDIY